MGMYTELDLSFRLNENKEGVVAVVDKLRLLRDTRGLSEPDMWLGASFYFPGPHSMALEVYNHSRDDSSSDVTKAPFIAGDTFVVTGNIRTNIKNYRQEIEKFLAWLEPWIEPEHDKEFYGTYRYEEWPHPVLIYNKEGKFWFHNLNNKEKGRGVLLADS